MKTITTIAVSLLAAALLTGCSAASSDAGLEKRVMALESTVATQASTITAQHDRINELDAALQTVELTQGPRMVRPKEGTSAITSEAHGGAHTRIAEFAPLAFTGPDCTGDAFLPRGGFFGPTGARQGFVFASRPNGTDYVYQMVAPNTDSASYRWESALSDGVCQNQEPTQTTGYAVVRSNAAVCGVPDLSIPATMWPGVGAPRGVMHVSDSVEVWTDKSCLTVVPAELLPTVTAGAG